MQGQRVRRIQPRTQSTATKIMRFPDTAAELDEQLAVLAPLTEDNPIAAYLYAALLNAAEWRVAYAHSSTTRPSGWLGLYPRTFNHRTPTTKTGEVLSPTLEHAGVCGAFEWIQTTEQMRPVFLNDLTYRIHGPDIIAQDMNTERYIVCEAKGTRNPIRSPSAYLKKTAKSGRQLSWEWCRRTVLRFANEPPAAEAFLALVGPLFRGELQRMLCVSRAHAREGGFVTEETRVWGEADLRKRNWLKHGLRRPEAIEALRQLEERGIHA